MKTPVQHLIRRPSRSAPVIVLALLLLIAGGLGVWALGNRLLNGAWPNGISSAVSGLGSTIIGAPAVLATACFVAVCGLFMILLALWPGAFERAEVLADNVPGQTAISRRDLARLVQTHVERVDGVHSTRVRVRRTRVNVTVFSVLDDLEPVRQAAQKAAEQAIQTLKPVGTAHSRVRIQHTS